MLPEMPVQLNLILSCHCLSRAKWRQKARMATYTEWASDPAVC